MQSQIQQIKAIAAKMARAAQGRWNSAETAAFIKRLRAVHAGECFKVTLGEAGASCEGQAVLD